MIFSMTFPDRMEVHVIQQSENNFRSVHFLAIKYLKIEIMEFELFLNKEKGGTFSSKTE